MIAFWKSAKKSSAAGRHFAANGGADAAVPDMEAFTAALQLRDVDPIHTFTATEELREAQAATDRVGDLLAQATTQLDDLLTDPEVTGSHE